MICTVKTKPTELLAFYWNGSNIDEARQFVKKAMPETHDWSLPWQDGTDLIMDEDQWVPRERWIVFHARTGIFSTWTKSDFELHYTVD